ncbi:MAG: hypothetical protein R3B09_08810 [Nannocystaceae bacterium]
MRRRRLGGLFGVALALCCGDAGELAPLPGPEASRERLALGVGAAVGRAMIAEAAAGRRVTSTRGVDKPMPWVDLGGWLLCLGVGCPDECVAELLLSPNHCGTGQGTSPDDLTVIATGCGADRLYAYEVSYDPLSLRDALEEEELPAAAVP